MCNDLLDKMDATGLRVSLAKLPPECRGRFATEALAHISMRRRNTLRRDDAHQSAFQEQAEHHAHA